MKRKVLTEDELRKLMDVKTTVAQARRIKERNVALLAAVDKKKEYHGVVGCPHCTTCGQCAWRAAGHWNMMGISSQDCVVATFGGASLRDVCFLDIQATIATEYGIMYSRRDECFRPLLPHPDNRKRYAAIRKFLRGHIEWADEVIKRGE